jgi:hypothetical protein
MKSSIKQFITKIFLIGGCFLFTIFIHGLSAQNRAMASVSFDKVGSYVVFKAKINNSSALNLILDSGIRNTLITELDSGDHITLNYSDVKELLGLGGGNSLKAYTSNSNTLKIGKLKFDFQPVFVLTEDVFNLSRHTGTKINGLIGMDMLSQYVVEVNYSHKKIRFYNPLHFIDPKGYHKMPLIIEGSKFFVQLNVSQEDGEDKKVKLLIDTGAELTAWFQTFKNESVHIPARNVRATIGEGLNGKIVGYKGRLSEIMIGNCDIKNSIVSFPDSACIGSIVKGAERDGSLGSQLLDRFNFFIDFEHKQFYCKPNENFSKPFTYNVAGIEIVQVLPSISLTEVWSVWENSPAAKAGVKEGDQIIEVNHEKAFLVEIHDLKRLFERPSKSPLILTLLRDGKEITVEIDMQNRL